MEIISHDSKVKLINFVLSINNVAQTTNVIVAMRIQIAYILSRNHAAFDVVT